MPAIALYLITRPIIDRW